MAIAFVDLNGFKAINSTSITKLLRKADEAMYEVKGIDTPLAVREYTVSRTPLNLS